MHRAEYRNRKKGMETGRTEEERSTGGIADRGEREEGKRKSGRLSSQNRAEADERKRMRGESPKAKAKGKLPEEQLWERIREGRKETNRKPSTKNREGRHEKSGRKERGKPKKRKRKGSTEEATVRQRREERGKEETEGQVVGNGR